MSLCTILAVASGCAGGSAGGGGSASASAVTDEDVPVTFAPVVDDPDPGDAHTLTVVTNPAHGSAQVVPGGFLYTPAPDFSGVDDFTFLATDGQGHAIAGTATVTVNPVDDPPAPAPLALATDEDTPVTATPAVTDPDPGDTFTAAVVTQPAQGAVVASGTDLTYTPAADFAGTDGFTFAVTDGSGLTATATATVTVRPVNDAPTSATATATAQASVQTVVIPTVVDPDPGDTHTVAIVSGPSDGIAVVAGTMDRFLYTADSAFSGDDSFTFTATDTGGLSVNGTATIHVTGANQAPTSASASITTAEDTPGAVTPTVTDPDAGDTHTFSIVSQPTDGTATVVGGQLVYTPDADFNGGDSFTFQATDAGGLSLASPATANVTVTPVNDPPSIASPTVIVTPEDTTGSSGVDVTDPDAGDSYTLSIVSQAANGTAGVAGTDLTYTPNADFSGSDAFTFRVQDLAGAFVTGTANVTVNPVNDAPVVGDLAVTTLPDTATSNLLVSDVLTDPDPGDTHTLTIQSGPAHGGATVSGLRITYTPDAGFFGVDVLTFTVNDGTTDSNTGTARVSVLGRFATGATPMDVAFGDFDGDGDLDIAVANYDDVLSLYLGDGAGGLSTRIDVPPASGSVVLGAVALAVGKLDPGPSDDLVILYQDDDSYSVALGNAVSTDITTSTPVSLAPSDFPQAVALADFDGDTHLDLAVASVLTDDVSVYAGAGDGTFGALLDAVDAGPSTSPWDVAAGDLDGDTVPDLATVALQPNADNRRWVTPWVNDGAGAFTIAAGDTSPLIFQEDADLAQADLDGDGRADAVRTLASEDGVAVLMASAAGALPTAAQYAVGAAPSGVALGDVDGDGDLDIVTTDRGDDAFTVLPGAGDGTFGAARRGPVFPAPGGVAVGDLNGDGRDDIATVHPQDDLLGVILR